MRKRGIIVGFALALSLCLCLQTGVVAAGVNASEWARVDIEEAAQKGFVPQELLSDCTGAITRQEYCDLAIYWLEYVSGELIGDSVDTHISVFSDTDDVRVSAAYSLGIVNGIKEPTEDSLGIFSPDTPITRQETAVMLMRVCRVAGIDTSKTELAPIPPFTDMHRVLDWALDSVDFVRTRGIMVGTGDNMFNPNNTHTKEQSIVTFNRLCDLLPPLEGLSKETVPLAELSPSWKTSEFEQEVFRLINLEREKAGVQPLRWDARLAEAAHVHSKDMAEKNYYAHEDPFGNKATYRANMAGYKGSYIGENLMKGSKTPESAVKAWLNSPDHKKNLLLEDYTDTGVSVYGGYWTQVFGKESIK